MNFAGISICEDQSRSIIGKDTECLALKAASLDVTTIPEEMPWIIAPTNPVDRAMVEIVNHQLELCEN